jgi:hypothetical protein
MEADDWICVYLLVRTLVTSTVLSRCSQIELLALRLELRKIYSVSLISPTLYFQGGTQLFNGSAQKKLTLSESFYFKTQSKGTFLTYFLRHSL